MGSTILQGRTQQNRTGMTVNDNTTTIAELYFYLAALGIFLATLGRLNVNRHQLPGDGIRLVKILPSPFEKLVSVTFIGRLDIAVSGGIVTSSASSRPTRPSLQNLVRREFQIRDFKLLKRE